MLGKYFLSSKHCLQGGKNFGDGCMVGTLDELMIANIQQRKI